jgi:2TM domain
LTGAEINDTVPSPTWVSGIWGIILVLHGWRVYGERAISEQEIQQEMGRRRRS